MELLACQPLVVGMEASELSGFVGGDCNRKAVEAVDRFFDAVTAETDEAEPELLCLAGPSGTGKTSLVRTLQDRLDAAGISTHWTTGDSLVELMVRRVRSGRTDGDLEAHRVLIVDGFESLGAGSMTCLEAAWMLVRPFRAGTSLVTVETTQPGERAAPATATLQRVLKSDRPIHHLDLLDRSTRRALIERACTRRGVDLDAQTLMALDQARMRSGAEVEGVVARFEADSLVDPEQAITRLWRESMPGQRGEQMYERRLLDNVRSSRLRVPHGTVKATADDFRAMVISWLLHHDLDMDDARISVVVHRRVEQVAAMRATIKSVCDVPQVKRFIRDVRP